MKRSLVLCALAIVSALAVASCDSTPPSGNGARFAVVETLGLDQCGHQSVASVQAVTTFNIDLRVDLGLAHWAIPARGGESVGTYDVTTRTFQLTNDQTFTLRAAVPQLGVAACVVRRLDLIVGRISGPLGPVNPDAGDAGTDASAEGGSSLDGGTGAGSEGSDASGPATFTATETIQYGPTTGSNCTDVVGVNDGQFTSLPCQQQLTLTGTATGSWMNR